MEECNLEPPIILVKKEDIDIQRLDYLFTQLFRVGFRDIKVSIASYISKWRDLISLIDKNGFNFSLYIKENPKQIIPFLKRMKDILNMIELEIELYPEEQKFKDIIEAIAYFHLYKIGIVMNIVLNKNDIDTLKDMISFFASMGIMQIRIKYLITEDHDLLSGIKEEIIPEMARISASSNGKVVCEDIKNSILSFCEAFERLTSDQDGSFFLCPLLGLFADPISSIFDYTLEELVSLHYKLLSQLLKLRIDMKSTIKESNYPICYWCLYFFKNNGFHKNL